MSVKGYYEAMRDVLDGEMARDGRLMLLGDAAIWDFEPEGLRVPVLPEQDCGRAELAMGVALSGMKPLLDLRGAPDARCALASLAMLSSHGSLVALVEEGIAAGAALPEGAAVYRLTDIRTAVGRFRRALRGQGISICLECAAATREAALPLPDDDDFVLEAGEPAKDPDEGADDLAARPAPCAAGLAFARETVDLTELTHLAAQAGEDAQALALRLLAQCARVAAGRWSGLQIAPLRFADAEELCLAPAPGEACALWAGRVLRRALATERGVEARAAVCLCACPDPARMEIGDAAALLVRVKFLAERPALLLLEE